MKDPTRLKDEALDQLTLALLTSVEREGGPDSGAQRRALTALGLGAAAIGTTSVASAAANATGALLGSGASLAPASTGTFALLKWLGVAAFGGVVVISGALFVAHGRRAAPASAVEIARKTTAAPAVPALPNEAPVSSAPEPSPAAEPDPSADPSADSAPEPRSLTSNRTRATPATGRRALQEETEILDRARSALESGDSARAMSDLDELARRHANGLLREEAIVLRVEALLAAGQRKAGEAMARRFLAEHPASPYGQRVRTRLRQSKESGR